MSLAAPLFSAPIAGVIGGAGGSRQVSQKVHCTFREAAGITYTGISSAEQP